MEHMTPTRTPHGDPTYTVLQGGTVTAWTVSGLTANDFPGEPALAEDRVDYRFINGFVDVGDLPCRKAFWATMVGRSIVPSLDWVPASLNLPGSNRRVEFTHFWHVPTHVSRWLRGTFRADEAREANFTLKTCGGVRIWVNGEEQVRFEPFKRNTESATSIRLALRAGDNDVLLLTEDLAERDTIWFFELELTDEAPLTVVLPVALDGEEVRRLEALARTVRPSRDVFVGTPLELVFDQGGGEPLPVTVEIYSHGHDKAVLARAKAVLQADQGSLAFPEVIGLPDGYHGIRLTIGSGTGSVTRNLDAAFLSDLKPLPGHASLAERKKAALSFSARHGAPRIGRVLAMVASGEVEPLARDAIVDATLASIDRRDDCSDFSMVPLLWLLGAYREHLPAEMVERIEQSVLNYRYWVDEPGNDVMWFWSENHVLCFHTSQLIAGQLLPDSVFTASGRTGRQQAALARQRLARWFDAVEAHGLAEWNSAAYYPVDFIGLLALEHWADDAIAARARHQLDLIFQMVALHTLAGVPAGSQGRAYDKELRAGPLTELAPFAQVAFGHGWLNGGVASLPMFCASDYTPPPAFKEFAALAPDRSIEARYTQGLEAGKLVLFKTEASQLSTVVDHKTGRKGHQQHVLDVRLAGHPMARLWINHPGEDDPWGTQRPSYWAGSGILPRVQQYRDVALLISDAAGARIDWTHAYLGRDGLDEVILEGNWLIARSGRGYTALYASNGLEMVPEGPTAGREARSPGDLVGWAAVVGAGDAQAFTAFRNRVLSTDVQFDAQTKRLVLTPPGRESLELLYDGSFKVGGVRQPFRHEQPEPSITYDSAAADSNAARPFYT
ncbi:hypothetical protein [Rhizobium oryzicola]|uniref:Alpha-L-rhamnosidase six-hairpin glycosidase domain-containing protein n=1 Tax=Rhizobium oryzicola TaxID=1232668 RepID=A0ABT8T3S1_9HYPH|nr:hypothetical protein [Rhizobium oryzicola]MDO1585283.1 hypothetical protein [Rhizobium oryzicola]